MQKTLKCLSLSLVMIILFSILALPLSAATNNCMLIKGESDDCDYWYSFIAKTGKSIWSNKLTFTQTKGVIRANCDIVGGMKTYGAYTIKVTNHTTKKTTTYYWKYKEKYTIKLPDSNTTYTIKIKAYQPSTIVEQNGNLYWKGMFKLYGHGYFNWSTPGTWRVTKTSDISWCH